MAAAPRLVRERDPSPTDKPYLRRQAATVGWRGAGTVGWRGAATMD